MEKRVGIVIVIKSHSISDPNQTLPLPATPSAHSSQSARTPQPGYRSFKISSTSLQQLQRMAKPMGLGVTNSPGTLVGGHSNNTTVVKDLNPGTSRGQGMITTMYPHRKALTFSVLLTLHHICSSPIYVHSLVVERAPASSHFPDHCNNCWIQPAIRQETRC